MARPRWRRRARLDDLRSRRQADADRLIVAVVGHGDEHVVPDAEDQAEPAPPCGCRQPADSPPITCRQHLQPGRPITRLDPL